MSKLNSPQLEDVLSKWSELAKFNFLLPLKATCHYISKNTIEKKSHIIGQKSEFVGDYFQFFLLYSIVGLWRIDSGH